MNGGAAQGDRLVISAPVVGTFVYLGSAAFTGGSDNSEARVSGNAVLIDVDGDGTADITIRLTGLTCTAELSANAVVFG